MRPPRRKRVLSGEEARLWGEIARLITPLRGRQTPSPETQPAPAASPKTATSRNGVAPTRKAAEAPPAAASAEAPMATPASKRPRKLGDLAALSQPAQPHAAMPVTPPKPPGLERRERIGLRRGTLSIDARIDLHGLRQADAHAALVGFLRRSRASGHARVLVVTGKGGDGAAEGTFSERGVLRRNVPHWLRGAELRAVVLGFEEAARHHGGAGALYVRLRRR